MEQLITGLQDEQASEKLKVSPNPVQKRSSIEFPKNCQGIFTLQITNFLGTTYNIGKTRLKGEGSTMEIDISKLSLKAGIYFLKVTSQERKKEVVKLIVLQSLFKNLNVYKKIGIHT